MSRKRKRKLSPSDYLLWAGGLLSLLGAVWLAWHVVAPDSTSYRRVGCGIALFIVILLVFGPELFDINDRRAIRRHCQAAGEVITKIETRRTHYKVSLQTNSEIVARKCVVNSGKVKWLG